MTPPDDPEAELKALYLAESREALDAASGSLASLRRADRSRKTRALDAIRVMAHRLKGSGGTYGYDAVTRLGTELEALMKAALSRERQPDAAFLAEAEGLLAALRQAFGF